MIYNPRRRENMPTWAIVFLFLAGVLFALKVICVLCLGGSLFVTHGAIFVRTPSSRIDLCLRAVPMKPGDLFVDLGCGDGRVLRAVTRCYGVTAVGYEINPLAFAAAKIQCLGINAIRIHWVNFWNRDLRDADVLFCYLFPDVMARLAGKLERELREGVRVISCNFPIPGWNAQRVVRPPMGRNSDPIYLYRFPDSCGPTS
jgi:SAM-dependent methyltransferase